MTLPDSTPESIRTPGPRRWGEGGDRAGCGEESAAGVFTVDAEFEAVSAGGRVVGVGDALAFGDFELFADEVDAGGFLGDRVLDLQSGVDLEEGDQAVLADEVFDGAGAVVAGFAADGFGGFVDLFALFFGQERGGGFFDEFLEAALQ